MDEFEDDTSVRIDAVLTVEVSLVVTRDEYEAWQDGDDEASQMILESIAMLAEEEAHRFEPTITEAWLLETGQGHPIARLQKWES